LTVSDNGIGKPDQGASQISLKPSAGLGTSLIQALAKQLEARVDTESDANGTAVSITHATFKPKSPAAQGVMLS
jgi:chemotaxis protein methyltransferase CheR